jgi:hypothetical protein
MRVAIPHGLSKDEVRRRFKTHGHEIGDRMPGGMADVTTSWPSEDRMLLSVAAMGQTIGGQVDIEDGQVVFEIALPAALSFIEPIVGAAIKTGGNKLLAPPTL